MYHTGHAPIGGGKWGCRWHWEMLPGWEGQGALLEFFTWDSIIVPKGQVCEYMGCESGMKNLMTVL